MNWIIQGRIRRANPPTLIVVKIRRCRNPPFGTAPVGGLRRAQRSIKTGSPSVCAANPPYIYPSYGLITQQFTRRTGDINVTQPDSKKLRPLQISVFRLLEFVQTFSFAFLQPANNARDKQHWTSEATQKNQYPPRPSERLTGMQRPLPIQKNIAIISSAVLISCQDCAAVLVNDKIPVANKRA